MRALQTRDLSVVILLLNQDLCFNCILLALACHICTLGSLGFAHVLLLCLSFFYLSFNFCDFFVFFLYFSFQDSIDHISWSSWCGSRWLSASRTHFKRRVFTIQLLNFLMLLLNPPELLFQNICLFFELLLQTILLMLKKLNLVFKLLQLFNKLHVLFFDGINYLVLGVVAFLHLLVVLLFKHYLHLILSLILQFFFDSIVLFENLLLFY